MNRTTDQGDEQMSKKKERKSGRKPKYKVGDKVRIKKLRMKSGAYGGVGVTSETTKLSGQVFEVETYLGNSRYKLKGGGGWTWHSGMLEPAYSRKKKLLVKGTKFRIGDLVVTKGDNQYFITNSSNNSGFVGEVVPLEKEDIPIGYDLRVKVVEHNKKPGEIGKSFGVESKYFKLYEPTKSKQQEPTAKPEPEAVTKEEPKKVKVVPFDNMSYEEIQAKVKERFGVAMPESPKPEGYKITFGETDSIGRREVGTDGEWAYTIFEKEEEGVCPKTRHKALLYLADCDGQWFDSKGNLVRGYLFFKKKGGD